MMLILKQGILGKHLIPSSFPTCKIQALVENWWKDQEFINKLQPSPQSYKHYANTGLLNSSSPIPQLLRSQISGSSLIIPYLSHSTSNPSTSKISLLPEPYPRYPHYSLDDSKSWFSSPCLLFCPWAIIHAATWKNFLSHKSDPATPVDFHYTRK